MKRTVGIAVVVLFAILLTGVALRVGIWVLVYDWVVGYAVRTLGLDHSLAAGVAWLAVAFVSLVPLWVLVRPSRPVNFTVFALVGMLAIAGWYVHRDDLFTPSGQPVRYVAITSSGLILSPSPGVDRKSGAVLHPLNRETGQLAALWLRTGGIPPLQRQPCRPSFSAIDGSALCWYERTQSGIFFAPFPGYSPEDGERLRPVTHAVISQWNREHEFEQKIEGLLASPSVNALRVKLVAPPSDGGIIASSVSAGPNDLPAGTRIGISIKFHPLSPESLGVDRLTAASIVVHKTVGLWPTQPIFLRFPEEVDGPDGNRIIPAGSTAEGFLAVNTNPNSGSQLLVSVSAVKLFLPGRHHPIPIAGHLDPSCAMPLMNQQVCDLLIDHSFPDTTSHSVPTSTAPEPSIAVHPAAESPNNSEPPAQPHSAADPPPEPRTNPGVGPVIYTKHEGRVVAQTSGATGSAADVTKYPWHRFDEPHSATPRPGWHRFGPTNLGPTNKIWRTFGTQPRRCDRVLDEPFPSGTCPEMSSTPSGSNARNS